MGGCGQTHDKSSVDVMTGILRNEDPGLVVLNGDLITGENCLKENATFFIDLIVQPLVDHNVSWASTYGNHDSDFNLSRSAILQEEQKWPDCRTTSMVSDDLAGVSNYFLPVYPSDCSDTTQCTPELILWFFDSRGGNYYQQVINGTTVPQENWVDQSVVDWFVSTNADLVKNYSKIIPSLAFVHIPTAASRFLQKTNRIDNQRTPGMNTEPGFAVQADGWYANGTVRPLGDSGYGEQDMPFMEALTNTSGLMAVFSGHDHGKIPSLNLSIAWTDRDYAGTTWCAKWTDTLPGMDFPGNGLNLCFGQRTGYGGYGTWIRGSRQVHITQEKLANLVIETWIRTEDAGVVGNVTLNSTYGVDQYTT